jgi:uncharacterized membrane protein YGL010W
MRTFVEQLSNYATYHRDRRNIVTHFIGVPMIVLAVCVLLSRPSVAVDGPSFNLVLNLAWIVAVAICVYYLALNLRYGIVMTVQMALLVWLGGKLAGVSIAMWLGAGIGLFVVGWVIQFIGHYYEGRKPAFVDDIVGLAIGPLFVTVEAAFLLGLSKDLKQSIEARAGPTHWGREGAQAA